MSYEISDMSYEVSQKNIDYALECVRKRLEANLKKHGRKMFINEHETFGVLWEEVQELGQNLREEDGFIYELLDVAAVAVFGYASVAQQIEEAGTLAKEHSDG